MERLRVLTGRECCRRQPERIPTEKLDALLDDYANSPLFTDAEKLALDSPMTRIVGPHRAMKFATVRRPVCKESDAAIVATATIRQALDAIDGVIRALDVERAFVRAKTRPLSDRM